MTVQGERAISQPPRIGSACFSALSTRPTQPCYILLRYFTFQHTLPKSDCDECWTIFYIHVLYSISGDSLNRISGEYILRMNVVCLAFFLLCIVLMSSVYWLPQKYTLLTNAAHTQYFKYGMSRRIGRGCQKSLSLTSGRYNMSSQ